MGLERYRKKRDFERTPEPAGRKARRRGGPLSFVVQRHAASHLHYDFRLEHDGVLLSWAVPKGPSMDPGERRLAIHVEDHPLEYGDFEGVIPAGEYGGGTVMVWDRGRWIPRGDPAAGLRRGKLEFELQGERLRGGWALVRLRGRKGRGGKDEWLLIKEQDDLAAPGSGDAIVRERSSSVLSGRSMEEIARAEDRVWRSGEAAGGGGASALPPLATVAGARRARFPSSLLPELATLVSAAPEGEDWLHELKYDGYRVLSFVRNGTATLRTRRDQDWTDRFPRIAAEAAALPIESAVLDGEAVVVGANGLTSFQGLQNAIGSDPNAIVYYAFDLPYLNGHDLRRVPLVDRKSLLRAVLPFSSAGALRYSDDVRANGPAFHVEVCRRGAEGIVSKRAASHYESRRTRDWVKVKCLWRQEFVVVGYTDPSGSRAGLGALLLGVRERRRGPLVFAGKVGTGFTNSQLVALRKRLDPLVRKSSPVEGAPRGAAARGVHWVRPELVAEVAFTEWTKDGVVRHPSFQGLREDRSPESVVRERPAAAGEAASPRAPAGDEEMAEASVAEVPELAEVRFTSPDRVLYETQGLTKLDLARYYAAVAQWLAPLIAERPLTLVRCPQGEQRDCFFQKHADDSFPESIGRVEIREKTRTRTYFYVDSLAGILSVVNLGALELHTWGARRDRLERPDRLVFDLDPDPSVGWARVVEAAHAVRQTLAALGLESFAKTTGGKGIHVVVPLVRRTDWDVAYGFAKGVAESIVGAAPDRYTATMSKQKRKGRIFIDYLRNTRGATAVEAYSTRARPAAPVSMPVAWEEVTESLRRDQFTVANAADHMARRTADPWAGAAALRQSITKGMRHAVGAA